MRSTRRRRLPPTAYLLPPALAALNAVWMVAWAKRIAFDAKDAFNWDSSVFLALGRGILNGLRPYVDLFEIKPPGIFFLFSLSLSWTGDSRLANWAQAFVVFGLGAIGFFAARRFEYVRSLSAAVVGGVVALYVAERSGALQVESYGAFFCAMYAFVVSAERGIGRGRRIALATLFLFLSVGFKEPFILVAAACALVVARSPREFATVFLVPAALTAVAGLLSLLACGYLKPYFSVYLSEVFSGQLAGEASPWRRGFDLERIFVDLEAFAPRFGWAVISVFAVGLVAKIATLEKRTPVGVAAAIVAAAAAVYLSALAVGLGGEYYDHHFAFAAPTILAWVLTPGFLAVFAAKRGWLRATPAIVVALFALTIWNLPYQDYAGRQRGLDEWAAPGKAAAPVIDAVLDRCGWDRYLFMGENGPQPYSYTRHSPYGPYFFQIWSSPREAVVENLLDLFDRAEFAVIDTNERYFLPYLASRLLERFHEAPPACAGDLIKGPIGSYRFYFRKGT